MQKSALKISIGIAFALLAALVCAEQTNEMSAALKHKPDLGRGRALFKTCAACHQPDGAGTADGNIPNIAGQHFQVVLKQLVDFRQSERMDLRMEASASKHYLKGPAELADVATFISKLPPQPTSNVGKGDHAQVGRQAYERACQHCHGAAGEGNGRLRYPRLAGQHYAYLTKQIDMMIGGSRFNVSWDHAQLLSAFTDDEMTGVADYLARLNRKTGQ